MYGSIKNTYTKRFQLRKIHEKNLKYFQFHTIMKPFNSSFISINPKKQLSQPAIEPTTNSVQFLLR